MIRCILSDLAEISVTSDSKYNYITTYVSNVNELQSLMDKLNNQNLATVKFVNGEIEHSYSGMTLMKPQFHITQRINDIEVAFGLRPLTEDEVADENVLIAISYLSDEQALTVKTLYPSWDEDPVGYGYVTSNPKDSRRLYGGKLWKLNKDHKKQLDWFPGADPTLWTEIIEGHAGTLEDPIPVPESVTTSGFEYVYGNYYSDSEKIYLAKREGKEDGEVEKLFFAPSALVGQYFEEVIE